MNVLIADDEKIVLEGLKYIIDWNSLGFTICQTASDGADALEKILNLKPDLVMMDIRMPKMDGIEMLKALRAQGCTAYVIILTAYDNFSYAQSALRLGAVDYLLKPYNEQELVFAVEEAIRQVSVQLPARPLRRAIQSLKDAGVQNIESIFYPGARHELLVETNKLEVFADIAAWLDKQLAKH